MVENKFGRGGMNDYEGDIDVLDIPEGDITDFAVESISEEKEEIKLTPEALVAIDGLTNTVNNLKPETPEQEEKLSLLKKWGERFKTAFGGKNEESYISKGMSAINTHKTKLQIYQTYLTEDPEKARKYALAVGKNPGVNYFKYIDKTGEFVDSTVYSDSSVS